MSIDKTLEWFQQAIPEPTIETTSIQIGCHLEEVAEMMEALNLNFLAMSYHSIADAFKRCDEQLIECILDADKEALLDSIIDQSVTGCGISHMLNFNHAEALKEVNRSNFSKFEDNKPVFDANGKITKGKHYTPPNLKPFI